MLLMLYFLVVYCIVSKFKAPFPPMDMSQWKHSIRKQKGGLTIRYWWYRELIGAVIRFKMFDIFSSPFGSRLGPN